MPQSKKTTSKTRSGNRRASKKKLRLAIIGTGGMANMHADGFKKIPGCEVVGGCDIDPAKAKDFCQRHEILHAFSDIGEMLENLEIDAVSVVVPDRFHAPITHQCLKVGKHVLCEKPLAINFSDAKKMAITAKKAGVVHMVNFSYRNWSALQGVASVVQKGKIGEVLHVEASYSQCWLNCGVWGDWRTNPAWLWRLSTAHGSQGALGDVGVHIVDFATYPVGPIREVFCRLKSFSKAPGNRKGAYILDANDSAVLNVEFANGALGTIHTSRWIAGHTNRLHLKISGTKGSVEIDSDRSISQYRICAGKGLKDASWQEVSCAPTPSIYERFAAGVLGGKSVDPDFARGAEVQKILDACFASGKSGKPVKI